MNCHPTLCGMLAEISDGKLVGVTGDEANPDSQGFLCVRGQASREIVDNPARLLHPLIRDRRADDFRRAGWDEALDRIVAAMRDRIPRSVGIWPGHGVFTTNYGTRISAQLLTRFANFHGCQFWSPAMICWGLGAFGLGLTGMLETNTKEDMGEHAELIILWAANLTSQPNTARHLLAAKRRGAHIVTIDVRRTEAAAKSDDVLLIRPGTDTALALAMMHVICAEQRHDAAFVAQTHGRLRSARRTPAGLYAGMGRGHHRHCGRTHRGAGAPICVDAAGDDRARRQLDAQRGQWLAGGARDRLPTGTDGERRHSGRRLRTAPWQRRPRPRPRRHHGAATQGTGTAMPNQMSSLARRHCATAASGRCC